MAIISFCWIDSFADDTKYVHCIGTNHYNVLRPCRPLQYASSCSWSFNENREKSSDLTKCWVFLNKGIFSFFMSVIQHCFICHRSDLNVSEDAGIKPRTVATSALAVRRSITTWLDLIQTRYFYIGTFVITLWISKTGLVILQKQFCLDSAFDILKY